MFLPRPRKNDCHYLGLGHEMSAPSSNSYPSHKLLAGLPNLQMSNVIQSFRPNTRPSPIVGQPTIISASPQNMRFSLNSAALGAPRFPTPRLAPHIRVINNAGNLVGRPGFLPIRTVPPPQQQSPSHYSGTSSIHMAPSVSKSSNAFSHILSQSQTPHGHKTTAQQLAAMKEDSVSSAESAAIDGSEFVSDVPVAAAMEVVDESGSGHATAVGGGYGEIITEETTEPTVHFPSTHTHQVVLVGPKPNGAPGHTFQGGFHQISNIRPVPFQIRPSSQTPLATGYYATSSQFSHLIRPNIGHPHSGRFCLVQERQQPASNQKRPCNCTKSSCLKL